MEKRLNEADKTMKMPVRIPSEEKPEKTIENVPDEIIQDCIQIVASYVQCRECENRFWTIRVPGHNNYDDCSECGTRHSIVG